MKSWGGPGGASDEVPNDGCCVLGSGTRKSKVNNKMHAIFFMTLDQRTSGLGVDPWRFPEKFMCPYISAADSSDIWSTYAALTRMSAHAWICDTQGSPRGSLGVPRPRVSPKVPTASTGAPAHGQIDAQDPSRSLIGLAKADETGLGHGQTFPSLTATSTGRCARTFHTQIA
jgi:hypothetical protein